MCIHNSFGIEIVDFTGGADEDVVVSRVEFPDSIGEEQ